MKATDIKLKMWSMASKKMSPAINLKQLMELCEEKPIPGKDRIIFLRYAEMKDVFGKELYEGDICKQNINGSVVFGEVVFNKNVKQFGLEVRTTQKLSLGKYVKIDIKTNSTEGLPELIGNIFENPNLLKNE